MALLLILAVIAGGPSYTAPQVQRSFHSQTGMRLVNVPSVTNTDLTAFETKPSTTARFGRFELYVVRPKALLARGGQRRRWPLAAEEVRHLRLHPGRREQRRVVVRARHERRRRHAQMPLRLEEGQEPLADLGGRPHPAIVGAGLDWHDDPRWRFC